MNKIEEAKRVFDIEISALQKVRDSLDDVFLNILEGITNCKGKVIITGIGKPGHIGTKIAATLSSLGTPSFYLHPAEAMHGDLGMISENDVIIAISYSGESEEVINILPNIRLIGAKIIGITGNKDSTLAKNADLIQVLPPFEEACMLGLAPTSSTTVELVYGDALAVVASMCYGFQSVDFGKLHPAGSLGKKLLIKVKDVMVTGENNAVIKVNDNIKNAILELSKKLIGMVCIVDEKNKLKGIITSGDLRRILEKEENLATVNVSSVMTHHPFTVVEDELAINALKVMIDRKYGAAPVVNNSGILIGSVCVHDILRMGIVDRITFSNESQSFL